MGNFTSAFQKIENFFSCLRGSQQTTTNSFQEPPLHIAVRNGNEKEVEKLLKKGAKVNELNSNGFSSLHYAVKYGYPKLVKVLMRHGGNINNVGCHGLRPLHMLMVAQNRTRVLDAMLKYKPDMDAQEILGNTILQTMVMIAPHNTKIIKKLLEYGSNPNNLNAVGNNCLHNIAMLERSISPYRTRILAKALIDKGLNIKQKNRVNNTPLHFAVRGNPTLVEILIDEGADINEVNDKGYTAFDVAASFNVKDILHHLIKNVVLKEHRGEYVKKPILNGIKSNPEYQKIRTKYEDEMTMLKLSKISDSSLSYYDLLCNKKRRRFIIKNGDILNNVSLDFLRFTEYRKETIATLNKDIAAINLATVAYAIVDRIIGHRLPVLCIEKISSFLVAADLPELGYFLNH